MEWIQRLGLRVEDPQSDGTVTLDECVYIHQSFNTSIIDVYLYHANVQLKLKTSFWFCICKRDPIVCVELIITSHSHSVNYKPKYTKSLLALSI